MAISLDGSTPAAVDNAGSTSATAVTASFSPPAGSLVAIAVNIGLQGTSATQTVTVADSLSNSYTAGPGIWAFNANGSWLFTRYYAAAPGSITVTATRSATGAGLFEVVPWVLTGAAASQAGAASNTTSNSATSLTGSITTTAAGSWALCAVTCGNSAPTDSGLTRDHVDQDSTDGVLGATGHAITSTPGAETIGWTIGVTGFYSWSALEILPAAAAPAGISPALPGRTWRRRFKHRQQLTAPASVVQQDDTVNAPAAASDSSTQPQATASIAPIAGAPIATGAAPQATPAISATPAAPTATGTAPQPVISATDFAGIPAATGAAAAVANPAAIAGTATAASTAPSPSITVQVLAGIPTATGTAPAPTVLTGTTVNAGIPTATGTAPAATVQLGAKPGIPTATGAAPQPAASPAVNAGAPAATGAAAATASISALTGIPAATGTASQPVASIAVKPGVPAATGTAPAPGIITGLAVNAGIPAATGTPAQPTVAASVLAGIPGATGSAPATFRGIGAAIASATGTAPQPKTAAVIFAVIPSAAGTVGQATAQSVLPHVTARSTSTVTAVDTSESSVTDPRDGTPAVTALATSTSSVT